MRGWGGGEEKERQKPEANDGIVFIKFLEEISLIRNVFDCIFELCHVGFDLCLQRYQPVRINIVSVLVFGACPCLPIRLLRIVSRDDLTARAAEAQAADGTFVRTRIVFIRIAVVMATELKLFPKRETGDGFQKWSHSHLKAFKMICHLFFLIFDPPTVHRRTFHSIL